MTAEKADPGRKKAAYVSLTETGSWLLGIGMGVLLAELYPSVIPWNYWIIGLGALLTFFGFVSRVWVTEKVD